MSSSLRPLVNAVASSSRLRPSLTTPLRAFSATARRSDVQSEGTKPNHRDVIERQRRAFEEKYGDKLKRKAEAEGVRDLDALKEKVMAPSVKRAIQSKRSAKEYLEKRAKSSNESTEVEESSKATEPVETAKDEAETARRKQAQGDRAGIKPLESILNLDLLRDKAHTADDVSKIWTAYHTAHPTLSASFLSAFLPTTTYTSMLNLATENPFFVMPLPRQAAEANSTPGGEIKMDEYEMFYLQWLFHPTSATTVQPSLSADGKPVKPPLTSSVIFTPLEEFKSSGEWAQPHLVLTHYPELANSHNLVLMRGEISQASETGPKGSAANPGYLLSQAQAQLLALALQRFYCADKEILGESESGRTERLNRVQTLRDFREKPEAWNWQGLVEMAYGGLV